MPRNPTPAKPAAPVYAVAVQIYCPTCNEPIPDPNGSLMWDADAIPRSVRCGECGEGFRVSRKARIDQR